MVFQIGVTLSSTISKVGTKHHHVKPRSLLAIVDKLDGPVLSTCLDFLEESGRGVPRYRKTRDLRNVLSFGTRAVFV